MKTEREDVSVTLSLWAIPQTVYRETDKPYRYELLMYEPYQPDAVLIQADLVFDTTVPPGIDLHKGSIEAVEKQINKVREKAIEEMGELESRLMELRALTAE